MFVLRLASRLVAVPIAFCTTVALASDIGTQITDQVSPSYYQYYLRSRLYAHNNNNRAPGLPNHTGARVNIIAAFTSFGLQVEDQTFPYERTTGHNVVATQLGTAHPDSCFVISGHYDSADNPGADDDASGVAAVMEIARVFAAYECEYTIKYIAFDMEEYGMVGSSAYVNAHLSDDIRGMISMDMIAYNTGSNVAEVRGSAPCAAIKNKLSAAIAAYSQGLTAQLITESGGCSDHTPFAAAGFQACLLIEDDYGANPCYHFPCDSVDEPDYINYAFAVKMARSVAGYLVDNAYVHHPVNCATGDGCALGVNGNEDCNANGVWDRCDILCGASSDANSNSIPDECDPHETWYVDAANSPGPGSGTQGDPFCRVQDALNAASSNPNAFIDVIVADGVYAGSGNTNLDFTGKPINLRSAGGNPAACIIDCQGSGRGFYFHSGETETSVVNGFTIRNGSVTSGSPGSYYGGGVYCSSSSPMLVNCAIIGNVAGSILASQGNGGGVSCRLANPKLMACTISGNAANAGGGLYCLFSNPKLANCAITGNTASYGAATYYNSSGSPKLTNSTLSANTANTAGGALYCVSGSNPALTNCILWGDSPQEIILGSSNPVIEYSDIQGGYSGTGNVNVDPLFVDPDGPDNDPNTWADNDYRLSSGSPCIDAGDPLFVQQPGETDLDGYRRTWDGDMSGGIRVDMGAYEFGACAYGDADCSGCVNGVDVQAFALAVLNPPGYQAAYPLCDAAVADVNADGTLDEQDIEALIDILLAE